MKGVGGVCNAEWMKNKKRYEEKEFYLMEDHAHGLIEISSLFLFINAS